MSLKSYGVNGGAVEEEDKSKDVLLQKATLRSPTVADAPRRKLVIVELWGIVLGGILIC